MIISPKEIQNYLKEKGLYDGKIDGILGKRSLIAAKMLFRNKTWNESRYWAAVSQKILADGGFYDGIIDGLIGPDTEFAVERYQDSLRGVSGKYYNEPTKVIWPKQEDMEYFYGAPGENIQVYAVPYKLKLAWDLNTTVTRISLNKRCAESALLVLERVLDHYGIDQISRLRLDLFGGSFNKRRIRGGTSWSTHAYGAALDFDPSNNKLRWNSSQASLARPQYDKWWEIWEDEGWVSLGRERGYDFMHVQAARL